MTSFLKCFFQPPAAYDTDLPQSPGPGGEPGLRSVDQQFWLHGDTAHHSPRPWDQRQCSNPLPWGPALLWLPLVPACEVPQQVRYTALWLCFHSLKVIVPTSLTSCYFGVFAGRTGTFLPQKCPPALQWSSACSPKRRPAGGRWRWPSVWKVRSANTHRHRSSFY